MSTADIETRREKRLKRYLTTSLLAVVGLIVYQLLIDGLRPPDSTTLVLLVFAAVLLVARFEPQAVAQFLSTIKSLKLSTSGFEMVREIGEAAAAVTGLDLADDGGPDAGRASGGTDRDSSGSFDQQFGRVAADIQGRLEFIWEILEPKPVARGTEVAIDKTEHRSMNAWLAQNGLLRDREADLIEALLGRELRRELANVQPDAQRVALDTLSDFGRSLATMVWDRLVRGRLVTAGYAVARPEGSFEARRPFLVGCGDTWVLVAARVGRANERKPFNFGKTGRDLELYDPPQQAIHGRRIILPAGRFGKAGENVTVLTLPQALANPSPLFSRSEPAANQQQPPAGRQ